MCRATVAPKQRIVEMTMYELKQRQKVPSSGNSHISQFVLDNFSNWQIGAPVKSQILSPYNLPVIMAVGGGKGGVGKSIISANLAAVLAKSAYRVLVIDLDLGCSNLHTHFGVSSPRKSIADMFVSNNSQFQDIILSAPCNGVAFVAGGREGQLLEEFETNPKAMGRLWNSIYDCKRRYKVDFVILDLGAGTHRHTLDFFIGSHVGALTVLPEPTSIENAYIFLKMTIMKLLHNIGENTGKQELAQDIISVISKQGGGGLRSGYANSLNDLRVNYPKFIHLYLQALLGRKLGVLVNQVRDPEDLKVGPSIAQVCESYFGFHSEYIGHLNHDGAIIKSLQQRRLFATDFPESDAVLGLKGISDNLLDLLGMYRRPA